MFEQQLESLKGLNSRATQSIIKYYNSLDKEIPEKIDCIEDALAQLDILLMYIIQVRAEIRSTLQTIPGSQKSSAYDALEELKNVQDAAKTVSFNLTAVLHSIRDLMKVEIQ